MAIPLKYNTASQEIPLGYFVDSGDGDTAEDSLTIANTDIKLWKNGATTLANKNSGGATHIAGGIYYATLDATDTDTVGPLVIFVHVSGALTVRLECVVYPAVVYDALFAGTDYLQVDAVQVEGSDATDQITASVPTAAAIRTEIDSNSTQLAAIVADTDELQTDDVPGLIAALNDPSAADIRTEIDSNSTQLAAIVADTDELQTDDVPSLIAALNDPTAAAIADAVWDEDIVAAHNTADTAGALLDTDLATILADTNELQTDDVPSLIAALNDPSAADIRTEIDANSTQLAAIVADTDELQTDDVPSLIAALNDPTAAAIADAVWDEASTGHVDAGKAGAQLWTDVDAILADTGTDGVVLADGAITAAKIATDAIGSDEIAAAGANKIADHTIRRTFQNACDSSDGDAKAGRSLLGAIAKLVNKVGISGSTLTVYEDDDSTSLYSQAISTDSGADPIIQLDTN